MKNLANILFVSALLLVLYVSKKRLETEVGDAEAEAGIEMFATRACENGADITFLTASEVSNFIERDPDRYFATLNYWDLYARRVKSIEDYTNKCKMTATDFSPAERKAYKKAAEMADEALTKLGHEIIAAMKWKFAMTEGRIYEDGLPHTRSDIIFVSKNDDLNTDRLMKTLVHEKLHLFQRANPEKMAQIMDESGYKRWKYRAHELRIRSNPDVDPWIYIDPRGNIMAAYYTSDKPVNISDINVSPEQEHPYELMAYELVKKL